MDKSLFSKENVADFEFFLMFKDSLKGFIFEVSTVLQISAMHKT